MVIFSLPARTSAESRTVTGKRAGLDQSRLIEPKFLCSNSGLFRYIRLSTEEFVWAR